MYGFECWLKQPSYLSSHNKHSILWQEENHTCDIKYYFNLSVLENKILKKALSMYLLTYKLQKLKAY